MVAVTTVQWPGPTSAFTCALSSTASPAASCARSAAAVERDTMNAKPRGFHLPAEVGAHQSVVRFAVNRKLLGMRILQAVFPRLLQHEFRSLIESRGGRHAMQGGEKSQILVRGRAARRIAQRIPVRGR